MYIKELNGGTEFDSVKKLGDYLIEVFEDREGKYWDVSFQISSALGDILECVGFLEVRLDESEEEKRPPREKEEQFANEVVNELAHVMEKLEIDSNEVEQKAASAIVNEVYKGNVSKFLTGLPPRPYGCGGLIFEYGVIALTPNMNWVKNNASKNSPLKGVSKKIGKKLNIPAGYYGCCSPTYGESLSKIRSTVSKEHEGEGENEKEECEEEL